MATHHEISHNNNDDTDYEDEYEEEEEEELRQVEAEEVEKRSPLYGTCGARGRGWSLGRVLDPRAAWVREWNRVFLLVCAAGLFVDPLFFYTLSISEACMCLFVDGWLAVTVTVFRCMTDALHAWNIWLQLKLNRRLHDTIDRHVAVRYFKDKKGFFFDLFVILPLPQVRISIIISTGRFGHVLFKYK